MTLMLCDSRPAAFAEEFEIGGPLDSRKMRREVRELTRRDEACLATVLLPSGSFAESAHPARLKHESRRTQEP